MLSSITPLGQRGRRGPWRRMVAAFWAGAILAGSVTYGAIGGVGEVIGATSLSPLVALAVILAAATLDMLGVRAPGPKRQVNEDWLGRYRDWVTGFGFGLQLGTGLMTIVPVWGVWALVVTSLILGWPEAIAIGVALAAGRSVLLMFTSDVDRPERLGALMERMSSLERPAHLATLGAYALVLTTGVLLAT